MTPGFVGADLANLLNEAALLAVRRGKDTVSLAELQEAVERVIGGLEKKNRVLNKMEKTRVAHHEAAMRWWPCPPRGAMPCTKSQLFHEVLPRWAIPSNSQRKIDSS